VVQALDIISSLTEEKIPDNLKEKIQLNREASLVFGFIGRSTSTDSKL
jgi:hypothetical protein